MRDAATTGRRIAAVVRARGLPLPAPLRRLKRKFNRLIPRGLYMRSLLIAVLPLLIAQSAATWTFFERHWDRVSGRLAKHVASEIVYLLRAINETPDPAAREKLLQIARDVYEFQIRIIPGGALGESPRLAFYDLPNRTLRADLEKHVDVPITVDPQTNPRFVDIRAALPESIAPEGGVLQVRVFRKQAISVTGHVFLMYMLGTSLILIVLSLYFLRSNLKPILILSRAVEDFGKGVDVPDVRPKGAVEVRAAARAFNAMRARIQRYVAQRTLMLAGVSHDLRTPITRMRLELELLDGQVDVSGLRGDLDQMERMLSAYLAFARGEGAPEELATPARLDRLVAAAVDDARRGGAEVDFDVDPDPPPDREVFVRREALRRALANLLDNAAVYATRIRVILRIADNRAEIAIDDDGPGIPAAQRNEALAPFRRLDPGRNLDAAHGVGLGLAITRDAARAMGGDLELGDSPLGGLRATIRFPL